MRNIPASVRQGLERAESPDAILAFLTISHPALVEPIRVVSDVLDYTMGGATYTGVLFGFRLLTDGEAGARTQIVVQAIDRRVTRALLGLNERARVSLVLRSSADFDLTRVPRTETVASDPIYSFADFDLVNVTGDAAELSGDVEAPDMTVEPWPSKRATQDLLPGLFR